MFVLPAAVPSMSARGFPADLQARDRPANPANKAS